MTEITEQTRAVQERMAQRGDNERPLARFGRADDAPPVDKVRPGAEASAGGRAASRAQGEKHSAGQRLETACAACHAGQAVVSASAPLALSMNSDAPP